MKNIKYNKGISLLGILVFGFILILFLSYFNVRVQDVVESPAAQENLDYVKGETKTFWDRYLAEPAFYIWNDVIIDIFWKGFINNMERIRDGMPTDFDKSSTNLKVNP